jgi:hypothetical protein
MITSSGCSNSPSLETVASVGAPAGTMTQTTRGGASRCRRASRLGSTGNPSAASRATTDASAS